jgi:hypothetical protein
MAHLWRELRSNDKLYMAFVECEEAGLYSEPAGFCARILHELHRRGYLWNAFLNILLKFAQETAEIAKESVEVMREHYKEPPQKLPFERYIHVFKPKQLISDIISWVLSKTSCNEDFPTFLFDIYSTCPANFRPKTRRGKSDFIKHYEDALKLLQFSGYDYGYFFLNQFEWSVPSSAKIREFCIGMRRILEASENKASIIVTLHPEAHKKLASPLAEHLRTLAPFDGRHYKVLNVLPKDGKLAVLLGETYITSFRLEMVSDPTHPFEPVVIRYICFLYGGNIRDILQSLHKCIEVGVKLGYPKIGMEFLVNHHQEILGRGFNEEKYREFMKFI